MYALLLATKICGIRGLYITRAGFMAQIRPIQFGELAPHRLPAIPRHMFIS